MDYLYPEAVAHRKLKDRVVRCYSVANPTKVSEVDRFLEKYKGHEERLFANLREKYYKYPECHM